MGNGGGGGGGGGLAGPVGGALGSAYQPIQQIYDNTAAGAGYNTAGKIIDDNNPYVQGPRKAREAKKEADRKASELYDQTILLNKGLDSADTNYETAFDTRSGQYMQSAEGLVKNYTSAIDKLKREAEGQSKDATKTYTNTIQSNQKNAMQMAKSNAQQAMSLKDASDPNNAVMKGIRDLYNKQGEGVRRQGQQDFGVLSALGAQAAQGQFGAGGDPMTAGQMGQIYGQNQAQAGDAYARAQKRMYDLQQQGLDKGFDQSNQIYQFGQDAGRRYSDTVKDIGDAEAQYLQKKGALRGERSNYAGINKDAFAGLNTDRFNMGMMGDDIRRGTIYSGTGRSQDALNQYYGAQQQNINNQSAADQATNAAKGQFLSSLIGAGATAYAGGK